MTSHIFADLSYPISMKAVKVGDELILPCVGGFKRTRAVQPGLFIETTDTYVFIPKAKLRDVLGDLDFVEVIEERASKASPTVKGGGPPKTRPQPPGRAEGLGPWPTTVGKKK